MYTHAQNVTIIIHVCTKLQQDIDTSYAYHGRGSIISLPVKTLGKGTNSSAAGKIFMLGVSRILSINLKLYTRYMSARVISVSLLVMLSRPPLFGKDRFWGCPDVLLCPVISLVSSVLGVRVFCCFLSTIFAMMLHYGRGNRRSSKKAEALFCSSLVIARAWAYF